MEQSRNGAFFVGTNIQLIYAFAHFLLTLCIWTQWVFKLSSMKGVEGERRQTANFVLVVDQNRERLFSFIKRVRSLLAPIEGLQIDSCSCGAFSVVWAAGKWAPVSHVADECGAAVVWGEPNYGPDSKRVGAERLWLESHCIEANAK